MKHRRILSLLLVLLLIPLPAVRADQSTTTYRTAAKDLGPNTEIFVITDSPYEDYPYYGAIWEPRSGVYFGRTCHGGPIPDGWGTLNLAEQEDESITSVYTSLRDPYPLAYWSYLYGPVLQDGEHGLEVNLNFEQERADCGPAASGQFDEKLREDFVYLASLDCPVFLRIGGEVNVWDNRPSPRDFIAAYRHIANLARAFCPNVALVYSPNYSSPNRVDLDSYYPGDDLVDWIGASLYYNEYAANGDRNRDEFYGVGAYADGVLNLQQVVNLSRMHRKPVIITEGGSARINQDQDVTDQAARRLERAYTFLNMVYPEVKCLVLSDTNFNEVHEQYSVHDSPEMTAAYNRAVAGNPTLLHRYQDDGLYYTRLSAYPARWEGVLTFAAYSNSDHVLNAHWYVDGVWMDCQWDLPYVFTLDVDQLAYGTHTLEVRFSDGFRKRYSFLRAVELGGFWDLDPEAYYVEPVLWAAEEGITSGVAPHFFAPESSCTRAQMITLMWNAAGQPDPGDGPLPFVDVPETAYYRQAVSWAFHQGITAGVDSTHFGPEEPCTRAQAVTLMWNQAGKPAAGFARGLADVTDGDYFSRAVRWAMERGITQGMDSSHFGPDSTCTRAQAVTLLYRAA